MVAVKSRDQGGNIAEWKWREDGQGAKVSEQPGMAADG